MVISTSIVDSVHERIISGSSLKNSILSVSGETGKKFSTLKSAYYRRYPPNKYGYGNHQQCKLTADEDYAVLNAMLAFSTLNINLTNSDIILMIKNTFNKSINPQWLCRFRKRHKSLISYSKMKRLASGRDQKKIKNNLDLFLRVHERFLEEHHFGPEHILQYDESRVGAKHGKNTVQKFYHAIGSGRKNTRVTRSAKVTSVIPFISAAGKILCVFYVSKEKFNDEKTKKVEYQILKEKRFTRGKGVREYFAYTDTGFVNQKLFKEMLKIVCNLWDTLYPGKEVLIIGDNSSVHKEFEMILKMANEMKYLNFFPPDCTHFLQPLDASPFGSFKNGVYSSIEERQLWENILRCKHDRNTVDIAQTSIRTALTEESIIKAFKDTGIYPFSKKLILQNFENHIKNNKLKRDQELVINCAKKTIRACQEGITEKKKKITNGKVTVRQHYCYTASDFREMKEAIVAQKKLRKREKREKSS